MRTLIVAQVVNNKYRYRRIGNVGIFASGERSMLWSGKEGGPAHICRFRPVVFSLGPSQGKRVRCRYPKTLICSFFSFLPSPLPQPRHRQKHQHQTTGHYFPPTTTVSLTNIRAVVTTHPRPSFANIIILSRLKY